jgi:hypothetical protein
MLSNLPQKIQSQIITLLQSENFIDAKKLFDTAMQYQDNATEEACNDLDINSKNQK